MDTWTSPANVAFLEGWLDDPTSPDDFKALIRTALPRMRARPNAFVTLVSDTVITRDTIFPLPRRVGVLFNAGCASSCEDLVQEAVQSDKVTTFGSENTAGATDFGNLRGIWLPGWRRAMVPIGRSRGARHDLVGLPPAVHISATEADPLGLVARILRGQ